MRRGLIALATLVGYAAAAHAKEKVVASLPPGKVGVQLEVACEPCKKGKDCLSVRAAGKTAAAAKLVLDEDSACRGGPNFSVAYSIREFRLSPALAGALIKEEGGGEAIAHSHWLVGIVDGKIRKLWDATFSTQEVVSIDSYTLKIADADGNGRQEVDYTAPFPVSNRLDYAESALAANEVGADTWAHQRLEFSDEKKAMVEKSPHEEYAAVLASLKTVNEALAFKIGLLKDPKCPAKEFLVLDTRDMPKLRQGFFVVAAIADSRAAAQAKLDRIKACRPQISGAIRQVR
jgi:hypothetical protein